MQTTSPPTHAPAARLAADVGADNRAMGLLGAFESLASARSVPEAATLLARKVCELDGWDFATVAVADGGHWRYLACWRAALIGGAELGGPVRCAAPRAPTALGEAVRRDGAARMVRIGADDSRPGDALPRRYRVAAGFPLRASAGCIGSIELYSTTLRVLDPLLEAAMGVIGAQLGQLVERSRLEQALRADEARVELAARHADLALFEQDCDLRYTWVSASGFSGICNLGEVDQEHLPSGASNPIFALKREVLRTGESCRREVRLRVEGAWRLIDLVVTARRDSSGDIVGVAGSVADITSQRRAHEANQWLAAIVESCDEAIISKGLDGIITSWNRGATRVFGYRAEEVIGRPVLMLIPPERHCEEARILERICRGESVERFETERFHKDGSIREVSLTVSPVRDRAGRIIGASKLARDVTEQRRIERQQKAMFDLTATVTRASSVQELYEAGVEAFCRAQRATRAALVMAGPQGELQFAASRGLPKDAQRAMVELGGTQLDLARGPLWFDDVALVAPENLSAAIVARGVRSFVVITLPLQTTPKGCALIAYDTPRRFEREQLQPLETIAGHLALAVERQRHESELGRLVEERTASLRAAIAQVEEFSYSVSHDLRAPLRAMQGYAKALLEDHLPGLKDEAQEYLGRIVRASERMDRLIQDTLTYSRMTAGPIALGPVLIERLVAETVQSYPKMQAPHAKVHVATPLPIVMAHEPLLSQAVSNLLGNAIKFVPPNVQPEVVISAEVRNGRVRLQFKDNGIGISREHQERVFGMFERVHPAAIYEGTGIGLAIVRKALERMGGAVGVESDGVHGSCFWIELTAC